MRPAESSTTCDRNASGADNGGFYDTRDDHEKLIRRPKDVQDNAIPSGSAMATHVLLKLGFLTGDTAYWDTATRNRLHRYWAWSGRGTGRYKWWPPARRPWMGRLRCWQTGRR